MGEKLSNYDHVKIAVIDRNKLFRELLVLFLTKAKFNIVIEASGKEELVKVVKSNTQVPVVCLIQIKDRDDGRRNSLFRYIRSHWPETKILLYSIESNIYEEDINSFDADMVLNKAASLTDLEVNLRSLTSERVMS